MSKLLSEKGEGWVWTGWWSCHSERVSKKEEVEVSRQGRYCHSERREESLWRRSCLEPKIHACDYRIATQLILRFAQNDNSFFIRHHLHYTFWTPSQIISNTFSRIASPTSSILCFPSTTITFSP